jgi:phosphatidylglycerol:prolipoprotein diacylglycerol transferase
MAYETYHPLFLYESIFNFLNMVFLLWISRKFGDKLKNGDVFLTYLISYPIFRFFMEFLRLDNSFVGGINANQTLMIVIAVASLGALIWRHRKGVAPEENAVEEAVDAPTKEDDEKIELN